MVERLPELEPFRLDDWITDVLYPVKSGKEASVYCCRAHPRVGVELLAAKIYHPVSYRSFRDDAVYQEGRVILDKRMCRAVRRKTRAGKGYQAGAWVDAEYETLQLLYAQGADVPKPYAMSGETILMEYVGDLEMSAPTLHEIRLESDEARRVFELLIHNVETWLSCNRVHSDLSPFNILYWNGNVKVIDFPQAVDPRFNRNAFDLLLRDVNNVSAYFAKHGIQVDSYRIAKDLWIRSG